MHRTELNITTGELLTITLVPCRLEDGTYRVFDEGAVPEGAAPVPEAEYVAALAPPLSDVKAKAIQKIDADTDAIYAAVVGNRTTEYKVAEEHASAFKEAGYTGDVPAYVQSWASAKGWTAQQAADDILATADQWLSAQAAIRATRLARKEEARAAGDQAAVAAALAAWDAFVAQMRSMLGA